MHQWGCCNKTFIAAAGFWRRKQLRSKKPDMPLPSQDGTASARPAFLKKVELSQKMLFK
ncbi:hypothetical protein [Pseudomonas sp. nanlin1]|uniref:hypothetical protein n=1 Tax=Pseudomonas sp. nanlin1 TaxID=3040605 RepID=UPI00388FDE90